jgi:hypothetical protein
MSMLQSSSGFAGDTLIGPSKSVCGTLISDAAMIVVMNMWIEGFISAANRLNKPDFLKGVSSVSATDIAKYSFIDCQNNPQTTIEEVAIATVANFRMLYAMEHTK